MEFKKGKDKEPDRYQHQIDIENAVDSIEHEYGSFSTIIDLPTGGGKTRIATDLCVKALESNPDNKILWLSDSIDLLTQSIDRFQGKGLSRDISYQLICSANVSFNNGTWKRDRSNPINNLLSEIKEDADILFASVETVRGYIRNVEKYLCFAEWLEASQRNEGKLFIIYDEVHHIGATKNEEFFRELFEINNRADAIIKKYVMIGLTATVYRYDSPIESFNRWFKHGWDKNKGTPVMEGTGELGKYESRFINNRISITDIQTLIDEGILKKPTIVRVDDFKDGMPDKDYEMEYLAQKIAKTYDKKTWNKTIIFVEKIKQADSLQKKLSELQVGCFAYTSQFEYDNDDLATFKKEGSKNYKIMITCDMVSEGFDVKDLGTVYLYSGIQSQILLRQRIGRVLRKSGDEEKTVYWQNYFQSPERGKSVSDIKFENVIEEEQDIQNDIRLWKKGMQLPAGMYLEALPADDIEEKEFVIRKAFLYMMELFGVEDVPNMDYFNCGKDKIYFRSQERRGYEQFYHMICADYWSCLIYEGEYTNFDNYAKALGVKKNTLIEDIKINCFYLDNVSSKDTSGDIIKKKRFNVKDDDIEHFYEWVVGHDLKMPEPVLHNMTNETSSGETNLDEEGSDTDGQDSSASLKNIIAELVETEVTRRYMNKHPEEMKEDLLDAIQLQQKIKKSFENKKDKNNRQKVYPDILRYGKNNRYIYQQLLSVRAIIENGAVFEKREVGSLNGVTGELAFIAKNQSGEYYQIKALARNVNDIADGDTLFLAQALITVPNHITVTEADVDEYQDRLIEILRAKGSIDEEKAQKSQKIVNEFIMALGYYNKRNDIIRMQCELFGSEKLPKLLQYVIYCECYRELSKTVSFYRNDELTPNCQSKGLLMTKYKKNLEMYGITKLDDLKPIEDVIADYRPYIKAVPYYQGIKPEFLCRMLNDMLIRGCKQGYEFYDTFGGSGTVTLNIDPQLNLTMHYNDLGIFNKSFFDVLKDEDCCKKLKERIKEFIDLIINHTGDDSKTQEFFEPYISLLNLKKENVGSANDCITNLKDKIEERETKYITSLADAKKEKHEKIKDDVDERLCKKEVQYLNILELILKKEQKCDKDQLRNMEKHLHVVVLKIGDIFNELKGDDYRVFRSDYKDTREDTIQDCTEGFDDNRKVALAFIFYIFNFFSKRPFYNSANIQMFARMIGSYKRDIDNACKIFGNVGCYGRDALDIIEDCKDNKKTVWYHDIPYSETNADNYVDSWFDEVRFTKCLSECTGDYIVASRFNICEKETHEEEKPENSDTDSGVKEKNEEAKPENNGKGSRYTKKQYGLVKFFSRFVAEDYCQDYETVIENEYKEIAEAVEKEDTEGKYVWSNVEADKEAKYIAFAFSRNEYRRHYKGEDMSDEKKKYFTRSSSMSADSIRRMLKSTQFTGNSVEVMITNMDLDLEKDTQHKIDDTGIWCFPTFKTASAYMVEPVTIIMSYKEFYTKMVLYTLSHAYEEISTRETAALFREFYKSLVGENG